MLPDKLPEFVLASASPRRRDLLVAAGFRFEVCPAEIEEVARDGEAPDAMVRRLARKKAEAVAARRPGEQRPIVGADTVVVAGERVLGKPESPADARATLRLLSGRTHQVITGFCVIEASGNVHMDAVSTEVRFADLSDEEIAAYVATGEPLDKAGAYAIQGRASRYVEGISGCYFNVVGLPVSALNRMLMQLRRAT